MLRRSLVAKQQQPSSVTLRLPARRPPGPPAWSPRWSRWTSLWQAPVTRLLTTVHADLVGYSRLFAHDNSGTVSRLFALHHDCVKPLLSTFRGRLVQTAGDSFLILFDTVAHAVHFAVALQQDLLTENARWPAAPPLRLRIGVDLGDVIMDGLNFHGDGVIVAARLQAVCPPDAVCVSRAVYDRGADRLGFPTEPLGPLDLKHVPRPVEAYVLWPGDPPQAHAP